MYASDTQLYTTENDFSLAFRWLTQSPPTLELEGNRLRIDENETIVSFLAPFEFHSADAELVAEYVEMTLFIKNSEIEFIGGYYSTLLIYLPYHAITNRGDLG